MVALIGVWIDRALADMKGLEQKAYELSIPGKNWAIEIKLPPSFAVEATEISPDGEQAKLSGSDQATGLQLSLFLEKAASEGDSKVARDFYWKRMQASPLKMDDVRLYEKNGAAVLEYIVKEVNWKNINVYLAHDSYWVDLHLSKIQFRSSDQESFEAILNNIKIISSQAGPRAEAGSSKPYSVTLPQHGKLILPIPSSWKRSTRKVDKGLPPTIIMSLKKGDEFETTITPIWSPDDTPFLNNGPALKWAIGQHLQKALPTAVEKEVPIKEFSGVYGPGYYYLVTDKAPKPGEYPYAVTALAGVGDLVLTVTILCRDKESEGIAGTICILQEARQEKKIE